MTDQRDQRLPYPPQLVALCEENERHEAEVVGWAVAEPPTPPSDPPAQRWSSRLRGSRGRGDQTGRPSRHSGPAG
jgi:hypothetical protein